MLQDLKKFMTEERKAFFGRYPTPSCKARRAWKNASRFVANAFEGDLRGGEYGHDDSNKSAGIMLKLLKGFMQ